LLSIKIKLECNFCWRRWNAKIKDFKLNGNASLTPGSGRLSRYLKGEAIYDKDSLFTMKSLLISSKSARILIHCCTKVVTTSIIGKMIFGNVNTRRSLGFLDSKWINASLDTNIDNFTFFDENTFTSTLIADQITYLK
jgi:hypothetical protein